MKYKEELKKLDKYDWTGIEWYKEFYIEFLKCWCKK